MPEKSSEDRNRITSLTTPRGRVIRHERLPDETALFPRIREIAERGKVSEELVFSTTARQDKKLGGLRLLPGRGPVLSLTAVLHPPMHASRSVILEMISAVAACRTLERDASLTPGIAWISDVYAKDRRVASFHFTGALQEGGFWKYMVVSAAISIDPADYNERLSEVVDRVFSNRNSDISDRVTEDFLQDFFTMYETFTADGSFSDEYNRRILYKNRRISATVDGKKITGKVKGLSEGGQLMLVKRDGTRLHLSSYGDVKGVR